MQSYPESSCIYNEIQEKIKQEINIKNKNNIKLLNENTHLF